MTSGKGRNYPDDLPRHSVSAGAAVIREDGRMAAIKRADNGEWVLPGGIVELDEDPRDTVRREVLEETVSPSRPAGSLASIRTCASASCLWSSDAALCRVPRNQPQRLPK